MLETLYDDKLQSLFDGENYRQIVHHCEQLLAAFRESPADNDQTVADLLGDLSYPQTALHNYPAAILAMQQRLEIDVALVGEATPTCMLDRWNLGLIYCRAGLLAEAEAVLHQGMHLLTQAPAEEQWQRAWGWTGLTRVHAARAEYKQAVRLLLQAAKQRLLDYGWHRPEFGSVYDLLAQVYWQMGSRLAAERALRKAIRIFEKAAATDSPVYARMRAFLSKMLANQGDLPK